MLAQNIGSAFFLSIKNSPQVAEDPLPTMPQEPKIDLYAWGYLTP